MTRESIRWKKTQYRLFRMVSIGTVSDTLSRSYDIIDSAVLIVNLAASFMLTFESLRSSCGTLLHFAESATVLFFAIDYVLRILTAECLFPQEKRAGAIWKFITSGAGIVDLLSFLPFYLPFFFPAGATVFRMFRVARIFRLFRINAYYDSMNVITSVLSDKKQQLLSSVFIIMILMLASSLCMYSVEHEAQPEVFRNAFSGLWWASSTLLTVGYGDIYPITTTGKILGMLITFLGVGMVAIPTGIISAGFVEHYSRIKRLGEYGFETDMHFVEIKLAGTDSWTGRTIEELGLPGSLVITLIIRDGESVMPEPGLKLANGDRLIIASESLRTGSGIALKEVILKKNHPWNGEFIKDLDISRQSDVVLVKRNGRSVIPRGDVVLCEGDRVLLYSRRSSKSERGSDYEKGVSIDNDI